jgi:hypothetical protein
MIERQPFSIQVAVESFGKRWRVSTLPTLVSRPSQYFKIRADAFEFANEMSRVEGWPVDDQTGGDA